MGVAVRKLETAAVIAAAFLTYRMTLKKTLVDDKRWLCYCGVYNSIGRYRCKVCNCYRGQKV